MTPAVGQFDPPSEILAHALANRQGAGQWDEDCRDLSKEIWNFGHRVGLHVDEAAPGDNFMGYVYSGTFDLVVQGQDITPLRPGMVYLIDPLVLHGAPGGSPDPIIIYVASNRHVDTMADFAREAIIEAEALIASPPIDCGEI